MLFQLFHDLVHVDFGLVILGLQRGNVLRALLEQTKEPLLFLRLKVQALQLHHQIAQHIADFAQILGAHGAESGVRELGDVFLRGTAVVYDLLGVLNVDLLGKVHDGGLLGRAETVKRELFNRDFFFLGLFLNHFFFLRRFLNSSGGGIGIQRQSRDKLFTHGYRSFL